MNFPTTSAEKLAWVWGCPMDPCPKCNGYNIKAQTPIDEHSAYFRCFDCGHKGPSVDCSGLRHSEIGKSVGVCSEMKRLWNGQMVKEE